VLTAIVPGADLVELLRARLIENEKGALAFPRAGVRDAVYRRLPVDERQRLHRAAAVALEQRGARASELAPHYLALGDRARGVPAAVAAAEESLAVFDHHSALHWLETARPLVPMGELDERLGDVRGALGDAAAACEHYRVALAADD